MTRYGYFLSTEDWGPHELIRQATLAEEAGFEALWISDHFHPWTDEQGNAPFVWTVLGALARETSLPVTTAVTCPTVRIHPAIVAQAAATTAALMPGRFTLGVGSGEALNEQLTGAPWPLAEQRLDMLEEAVEIMRALWTGEVITHRGPYYDVEHARLYTLPDEPPKIYMSAFGPEAADLAGRIADGFISTSPDAETMKRFEAAGGAGKPKQAGAKVCFAPSADEGLDIVLRLWPNQGLPGELAQVLRTPEHFMQASSLVTRDAVAGSVAAGPDAGTHRDFLAQYVDAGFDEVYVNQIGADQDGFFRFYRDEVLPALRST